MYPENNPPMDQNGPCNDNCGILPPCAPLAVPYVPFQQTGPKRYAQQEALANGTLFPGLDLPFQVKGSVRKEMGGQMAELQALEFVLLELALYLDTHQEDKEAFALFQQYADLEQQARSRYEAANGPLTLSAAAGGKDWSAWLKGPWPWERQEGGK